MKRKLHNSNSDRNFPIFHQTTPSSVRVRWLKRIYHSQISNYSLTFPLSIFFLASFIRIFKISLHLIQVTYPEFKLTLKFTPFQILLIKFWLDRTNLHLIWTSFRILGTWLNQSNFNSIRLMATHCIQDFNQNWNESTLNRVI